MLLPAGTTTLAGMCTAVPATESCTVVSRPTGLAIVTVPLTAVPPTTFVELNEIPESTVGFTVSLTDLLTPSYEAVMLPAVLTDTTSVVMLNTALDEPAGTTTVVGTCAAELAELSVTGVFDAAGPLNETVPVREAALTGRDSALQHAGVRARERRG